MQALPKGDRGELAVELLTEIGVDAIVPWSAANCVTRWKGDRVERGHRRGPTPPARPPSRPDARGSRVVEPLASTADVLGPRRAGRRCASSCTRRRGRPIGDVALPARASSSLVVGPEGGLSAGRAARRSRRRGRIDVRLGPSVLRTSSAGIAAVAALLAADLALGGPPR